MHTGCDATLRIRCQRCEATWLSIAAVYFSTCIHTESEATRAMPTISQASLDRLPGRRYFENIALLAHVLPGASTPSFIPSFLFLLSSLPSPLLHLFLFLLFFLPSFLPASLLPSSKLSFFLRSPSFINSSSPSFLLLYLFSFLFSPSFFFLLSCFPLPFPLYFNYSFLLSSFLPSLTPLLPSFLFSLFLFLLLSFFLPSFLH